MTKGPENRVVGPYLRVVLHGTSAVCPKPLHQTYTGPTWVITKIA